MPEILVAEAFMIKASVALKVVVETFMAKILVASKVMAKVFMAVIVAKTLIASIASATAAMSSTPPSVSIDIVSSAYEKESDY